MRRIKNLEPERCPWCGETLHGTGGVFRKLCFYERDGACKNWSRRKTVTIGILFWVLCLGVLTGLAELFLPDFVASRIGLAVDVLLLYYLFTRPLVRKLPDDKWWKEPPAEPMIGKVDIRWYTMKEGGIGLPRIRITNDRIFVVCLVDKEGVPVSQTICVRLRRLFLGYWKATKVFLISDDLWKEDASGVSPWEKAEKMLIYNKREVIGEGVIRREVIK